MRSRLVFLLWLFCGLMPATAVTAQDLPKPDETVVLEVRGNIAKHNNGETAQLSMKMLRRLGVVGYVSSSPWLKGRARFKGVLLRDVLQLVGAPAGSDIRARALDEYAVTIPWSDIAQYDVLLAFEVNGVTLNRRGKGPLWIVYPQDDHSELKAADIANRWIWQLETLDVQ